MAKVADFQSFYDESVAPFVKTCSELKGCEKIGTLCDTAFKHLGKLMQASADCKKPTPDQLQKFVAPISDAVMQADKLKDNRNEMFNHQSAFSEAIQCMNWVFVSPAPGPMVQGQLEAADFYLMTILKKFKDTPQGALHKAFVAQLKAVLTALQAYIKKHHTTGITWNAKGSDLASFKGEEAAAPAEEGGCPPPPPDMGDLAAPPAPEVGGDAGEDKNKAGMAAVFNQLNVGCDISKGLKHVTKDMKTKNRPKDEAAPAVQPKAAAKPAAAAAPAKKQEAVKPPSMNNSGNKWFVENYVKAQVKMPEDVEQKASIFISGCKDSTIEIPMKINSFTLNNCTKTAVVFQGVVANVEVVNCKSVTLQCLKQLPSISVEKTAGCQLLLSEDVVKNPPPIYTACISEMNIQIPGKNPGDDPIELAVPEQYITTIKDRQLHTECVQHTSA